MIFYIEISLIFTIEATQVDPFMMLKSRKTCPSELIKAFQVQNHHWQYLVIMMIQDDGQRLFRVTYHQLLTSRVRILLEKGVKAKEK